MTHRGADDNTGEFGSPGRADFHDDAEGATGADAEAVPRGVGMLVVRRGPNVGATFTVDRPAMTAGRHPASDIFLDDITVSRRHAEFLLTDGVFTVVDLGSLNHTYVNREPVDSAVLSDGDQLQIGNFRLVFRTGPTP